MSFGKEHINPESLICLKNGDILSVDELYKSYNLILFSFVFRNLQEEAITDTMVLSDSINKINLQ